MKPQPRLVQVLGEQKYIPYQNRSITALLEVNKFPNKDAAPTLYRINRFSIADYSLRSTESLRGLQQFTKLMPTSYLNSIRHMEVISLSVSNWIFHRRLLGAAFKSVGARKTRKALALFDGFSASMRLLAEHFPCLQILVLNQQGFADDDEVVIYDEDQRRWHSRYMRPGFDMLTRMGSLKKVTFVENGWGFESLSFSLEQELEENGVKVDIVSRKADTWCCIHVETLSNGVSS